MLALVVGSGVAAAQPVITAPANGTVFRAGPDFATDTYNDAWDFSNIDDLSPFPDEQGGWNLSTQARTNGRAVFLSGGRFVATTDTTAGNKISTLFRGGTGLVNTGRHGAADALAIPTSRFGKLAIKMRLTNPVGAPNQLLGIWYHRSYGASDEASNAGQVGFGIPTNGWVIYTLDLGNLEWMNADGTVQTGALSSPFGSTPRMWANSALVRGFEFRATSQGGANIPVEVDWVRLTGRDGTSNAASMTINYTGCTGTMLLRITDADGTFTLARGTGAGNGSLNFNYGILAPGNYSMTLNCNGVDSAARTFVVNAPPQITVLNPDETGGADFATDVLSNAWDMDTVNDVRLATGILSSPAPAIIGGEYVATGDATGDPQATLLNGGADLISTRRYRKLTFTLTLDTPFGLNEGLGEGSLVRVFWGSQTGQAASTMTTTNDLLVWPGRNTYTIDLHTLSLANGGLENECIGTVGCPQIPWSQRSVRYFRIDPHEAKNNVQFRLGRVTLAAPDEVAVGSNFNVSYRFADADSGSTYQARLYIDGDLDPSSGLQQIGTTNGVSPGSPITFAFNTIGIAPNEYFVYIEIVETRGSVSETRGAYSTSTLRVFSSSSTSPRTTISNPTSASVQPTPFTITGCAFDEGNTSGINVDDIAAFAIAGAGVQPPQAGTTQVLGFGNTLGNLVYGPTTGTNVACPGVASAFANSGFRIEGISGLSPGNWTLRVITRSTISGAFTTTEVPFSVINTTGAPENFSLTASGNTVTLSFTAPTTGPPVGGYVVDGSADPNMNPVLFNVLLPAPGTYSGQLTNGTWYMRVFTLAPGGARGAPTPIRSVTLGPTPPQPPGPPTLTATQVASNPIQLNWTQGSGGAPTLYTLHAGTSAGASNLAVAPMGTLTTISAVAPTGVSIFVRVVASNAGGSATSNEINFTVPGLTPPGTPTLQPAVVSGRNVTLNWTAGPGGAPSSYTVTARTSATGPVVATLPGLTGNTFSVAAPPGTFFVTIQAVNAAGTSAASNQITIVVP